jgi:hypothetical protein
MVRVKHDKPRGILHTRAAQGLSRYWASDDLAPFVEHFWIVRWNLDEPETAETLPHPPCTWCWSAGARKWWA